MKVILLSDVLELGKKNDVKDVKDGFGRNFLLARKLAVIATPSALKQLETKKKKEEEQKAKKKETIKLIFEKIKNQEFEIKEKANEKGELFGSIGKERILLALKEKGFDVEEKFIQFDKPLKSIGIHKINLELEDLRTSFNLNVVEV